MVTPREVKTIHSVKASPDSDQQKPGIHQMGEVDTFSSDELDALKLIYAGMPASKVLNTFRELRTQLMQMNNKSNFVCMVSSISHQGGASYIASNLAAAFALDITKTSLIIDANLYAPSVDRLILGEAKTGITDYLANVGLGIKDIVYATGVPRVRAIPIGGNSEGAAEYFSSEKMLGFVNEIRERYSDRYIFIDAPPVSDSSEARILAEIADMVVLVVPYGKATLAKVREAIQIVGGDKPCGLVYNN